MSRPRASELRSKRGRRPTDDCPERCVLGAIRAARPAVPRRAGGSVQGERPSRPTGGRYSPPRFRSSSQRASPEHPQVIRRLLCRVFGHQWFSPPPRTWCLRCGEILIEGVPERLSVAFDRLRHELALLSPRPTSSSYLDRLSQPAIERASRAGTAVMEAPAPEDTKRVAAALLRGHHSALPVGVEGLCWCGAAHTWLPSNSLTPAPVRTDASSTSTPTPSPDSPHSIAGSSR